MADKNKLSDLARGATEVNLRFTASLLNLSKDYLRAMSDALMDRTAADEQSPAAGTPAQGPSSAPLIVAGRRGETGNAAFSISNSSATDGSVTLTCRGDFGRARVWTDPEQLPLKSGDVATPRILARFDASLPVGEDMPGDVYIPELDMVVAEFVVRRLPDAPAKKKAARRSKKKKKAR